MTEFIKAKELKKKYQVQGRFYIMASPNLNIKCRSLLTITDTTTINEKKMLVIMLNPGSSRPHDDDYLETEILISNIDQLHDISLIDTKPDTTQYQIMRVMDKFQFSYANIINLYDIREPKSDLLFDSAKNGRIPTEASIFSDSRQTELSNYFTDDTTVILAWGKVKAIEELEKTAIDKVNKLTKKIYLVRGKDNFIGHPSPQNHNFKLKWLYSIYEQLKELDN